MSSHFTKIMLVFFLISFFLAAVSRADPTLACAPDSWTALSPGWSALGSVEVAQIDVATAGVTAVTVSQMMANAQLVSGEFVGHVHVLPCDMSGGGGHFQFVNMGTAIVDNELWFGPANTTAPGSLSGPGPVSTGTIRVSEMMSFVIHEKVPANGTTPASSPKRVCCNLAVTSTTAAQTVAMTTGTEPPVTTAAAAAPTAEEMGVTTPVVDGGAPVDTTSSGQQPQSGGAVSSEDCAGDNGCECAGSAGTCTDDAFICAARTSSSPGLCLRPLGELCPLSGSPGCPCGAKGACLDGSKCMDSPVSLDFRVCVVPLDGSVTQAPVSNIGGSGPFSFITDLIPGVPEWAVPVAGGVLLLLLIAICFCVVKSCNSGGGGGGNARFESPSVAIAMKQDGVPENYSMPDMTSMRDGEDDDDSALFMPSSPRAPAAATTNHYQAAPHSRPPPPMPPGSSNPGAGRPPPPPPPGGF